MDARERGSTVPLLAVVVLAAGAGVMLVARLGEAALHRAQARTAADAAALAGAAEGRQAASDLAVANGAELAGYRLESSDAKVRVRLRSAEAVASARRSSGGGESPGNGAHAVAPAMRAALARAEQLIGEPIDVVGVHDAGLAIDVRPQTGARLAHVGPDAGICRPEPEARPQRFEVCR